MEERPKFFESVRQTKTSNQIKSSGLEQWGSATRNAEDGRRKGYGYVDRMDPPNMSAGRGIGNIDAMIDLVPRWTRNVEVSPDKDTRAPTVNRSLPGFRNYDAFTNRLLDMPRQGIDTRFYDKAPTPATK